jgi:hypothetical protein
MAAEARHALSHPKYRGTKSAVYAGITWTILVKTTWLPIWAEALSLPRGFFADDDIAGYCAILLAWTIREIRELIK